MYNTGKDLTFSNIAVSVNDPFVYTYYGDIPHDSFSILMHAPAIEKNESLTLNLAFHIVKTTANVSFDLSQSFNLSTHAQTIRERLEVYEHHDSSEPLQLLTLTLSIEGRRTGDSIPLNPELFSVSFAVECLDQIARYELFFASLVLVVLLFCLLGDLLSRVGVALLGAVLAVCFYSVTHSPLSLAQIWGFMDQDTLILMVGVMLVVGLFADTGIIQLAAIRAYLYFEGRPWPLYLVLTAAAVLLSCILDNIASILIIGPVSMEVLKLAELDPLPLLICEMLLSNLGGAATPVGDPPNLSVVSNWHVQNAGVDFLVFTSRMLPGVLLCFGVSFPFIKRILGRSLTSHVQNSALRHEIATWERSLTSLSILDASERLVRARLKSHITTLRTTLSSIETLPTVLDEDGAEQLIDQFARMNRTHPFSWLSPWCFVVVFLASLFLSRVLHLALSLQWIAVAAFVTACLLLGDRKNMTALFTKIDWQTVVFCAALSICVHILSLMGLITTLGAYLLSFLDTVSAPYRLLVAITIVLWLCSFFSSVVSMPITTLMLPLIIRLSSTLPLKPLLWALVFGASLGANGTAIGSGATVALLSFADTRGVAVSFRDFSKVGFPYLLQTTFIANVYLALLHCVLEVDS